MTNINGQINLGNNYRLQQQLATMPPEQQEAYLNYLYGTGASDEVIFETYNNDGHYCTDGKDDGKIDAGTAVGCIIEGAADTIANGIKGIFTNKEGKFSLWKTLGSVATTIACFACPPLGIAACAVGGVMGTVQLGKGIHKAVTADTDAEAKAAFENIGGGTLTVAASVAGAKGGLKAMKASSAAQTGGFSALEALKNSPKGSYSAANYAKAFTFDAVKASQYNIGQMQNGVSSLLHLTQRNNAQGKKIIIIDDGTPTLPDGTKKLPSGEQLALPEGTKALALPDGNQTALQVSNPNTGLQTNSQIGTVRNFAGSSAGEIPVWTPDAIYSNGRRIYGSGNEFFRNFGYNGTKGFIITTGAREIATN